jgi:hypothetical protein
MDIIPMSRAAALSAASLYLVFDLSSELQRAALSAALYLFSAKPVGLS